MKRVYIVYASNRPPDKSVNIFFILISHPKHMLWVLKRTVTMGPKTAVKTDGKENINIFLLKSIANLITKLVSALLFPQIFSALSSGSVFFES